MTPSCNKDTATNTTDKYDHEDDIRTRMECATRLTLQSLTFRPGGFWRCCLFHRLDIAVIHKLLHHNILRVNVSEWMLLNVHEVAERIQAKILKKNEQGHCASFRKPRTFDVGAKQLFSMMTFLFRDG